MKNHSKDIYCQDCFDTGIIPDSFPEQMCHCISDNGIIERAKKIFPSLKPLDYYNESAAGGYIKGMKSMRNMLFHYINKDYK